MEVSEYQLVGNYIKATTKEHVVGHTMSGPI